MNLPAGWVMDKRCTTGVIGGMGECLFCGADSGQSCLLVPEDDCPCHVAHELDSKYCARCGIHVNELRPD